MKTKILLFIAGAAVITLSFTFGTTARVDKKTIAHTQTEDASAPAGGLALEEK